MILFPTDKVRIIEIRINPSLVQEPLRRGGDARILMTIKILFDNIALDFKSHFFISHSSSKTYLSRSM